MTSSRGLDVLARLVSRLVASLARRLAAWAIAYFPWPDLLLRLAVRYRSSHRGFLLDISKAVAKRQSSADLGCIFVPVCRTFEQELPGLVQAANLALARETYLIVCCSKKALVKDFPPQLAEQLGHQLILLDFDKLDKSWLPRLRTATLKASKLHRDNDVGRKRNLALVLARILGWDYVLFMDDDVSVAASGPTLDIGGLEGALETMRLRSRLLAVGWTLEDFNDNSLFGHARSAVGMDQGVFIGGGALLVRCGERVPYFPDIYNEDWLFVIALAANSRTPRRVLGWAGRVRQLEYNPFLPSRARSEEAGDTIAECLMNLLEDYGRKFNAVLSQQAGCGEDLHPGYWGRAIKGRRTSIKHMISDLSVNSPDLPVERRRLISSALQAAERASYQFKAEDLASYVRVWRNDQKIWRKHLEKIVQLESRPIPRDVLECLRDGKAPGGWSAVQRPVFADVSASLVPAS